MTVDARVPPSGSRILYPNLPTPLTPTDLDRLFSPGYADRQWVLTVARTPRSQVAVLVQLLAFRAVGRFLTVEDIPASVVEYVAREFKVRANTAVRLTNSKYSARTWYRHQDVILAYLGVMAWGDQAQQLAESTMMKMAEARTDPADLINAAVDALVRHRFELPALIALRRMAGTAHHAVNERQWRQVCSQLKDSHREELETLLVVAPDARESPFAQLCSGAGRATRKNLKALVERYAWLLTLPDPTKPLESIANAKVLQWANEARRLKAPELRAYGAIRRRTLLLAVIREARGRILDEMTQMLLKLARKIEWRSDEHLNGGPLVFGAIAYGRICR